MLPRKPIVYLKLTTRINKNHEQSNLFSQKFDEYKINHINCSYFSKQVGTSNQADISLYYQDNLLLVKVFEFQVSQQFYGFSSDGKIFYICNQLKKKILIVQLESGFIIPYKIKFTHDINYIHLNNFILVQHQPNMIKYYTMRGKYLGNFQDIYGFIVRSLSSSDNSFTTQEQYTNATANIMSFKGNKLITIQKIKFSKNIFHSQQTSINSKFLYIMDIIGKRISVSILQKITNHIKLLRKLKLKDRQYESPFFEKPNNQPYMYQIFNHDKSETLVELFTLNESNGKIKTCGFLDNKIDILLYEGLRIVHDDECDQISSLKYLVKNIYSFILQEPRFDESNS